MKYYATGENRDSYLTGVRPSGKYGATHDVNKRRDNLPDNVFNYIKDGVQREERMRLNEEESRARVRVELVSGKGGKKMAGGTARDEKTEMDRMERLTQLSQRHQALIEVYKTDMKQWEESLAEKGLATQQ